MTTSAASAPKSFACFVAAMVAAVEIVPDGSEAQACVAAVEGSYATVEAAGAVAVAAVAECVVADGDLAGGDAVAAVAVAAEPVG